MRGERHRGRAHQLGCPELGGHVDGLRGEATRDTWLSTTGGGDTRTRRIQSEGIARECKGFTAPWHARRAHCHSLSTHGPTRHARCELSGGAAEWGLATDPDRSECAQECTQRWRRKDAHSVRPCLEPGRGGFCSWAADCYTEWAADCYTDDVEGGRAV